MSTIGHPPIEPCVPEKGRTPFYPVRRVLILLWLTGGTGYLTFFARQPSAAPVGEIRTGVDPNLAPWWELALLPRLGPAIAREVVSRRTEIQENRMLERCAFDCAGSLTSVRGIGPKMLLRLGPHLRFDSCLSP